MLIRRRQLLTGAAAGAAFACLPRRATAAWLRPQEGRSDAPDLAALAAQAVDAARSAGAAYADVRLTQTREHRFYGPSLVEDTERTGVGVRVLVNGYWGFLGSAVWTSDEMARLARAAVAQAKANGQGLTREVDLGTVPPVVNGTWTMPVKYDPFDISTEEKSDFIRDALNEISAQMDARYPDSNMSFRRQLKVFASSDGSSWRQTTYCTEGALRAGYRDQYSQQLQPGASMADFLTPAGKGWEHISESGIIEQIPRLVEEAELSRHLIPADVGTYDMVLSASAMASLLDATIGTATELDRAMGYEANAQGTSYLNDPLAMLGTLQLGSRLLTVTGERSAAGDAATVRWDDEGVVPAPFPIVRDGVLTDFQTTREQAAWLASYYGAKHIPVRSHGCAASESGLTISMQHTPNLHMTPGTAEASFETLVGSVKKGVAVLTASTGMDQQQTEGIAFPVVREIVNGKLGRYIGGAGLLFRSGDFWKQLTAIGGASSQRSFGFRRGKGEPHQETTHSVRAVPGVVSGVRLIDIMRKA